MPVLRGLSRRVKQDSEANEMSVGERHKVPNVAWESKTLLVLEKDIPLGMSFFYVLSITICFIEGNIRKFVIGRKNFVAVDTVAGAKASAVCYSIVLTPKIMVAMYMSIKIPLS